MFKIVYYRFKMQRLLNIQTHFIANLLSQYQQEKEAMKIKKIKNSYKANQQKLIPMQINLKDLVPNFFSQNLPLFEYQKINVDNKKTNHMQNSYIMWKIPINNKEIKNSLRKFKSNQIRIGRMLEVMDSVAGLVAYRHCFGSISKPNVQTIVTGSVDSFHLFETINAIDDIQVQGFLNHTGKTSMEIQINLIQTDRIKANSLFTMISRDSSNLSKGYPVPTLNLNNLSQPQLTKAKLRYQQGIKNTQARKKQMSQQYSKSPPSLEDIKFIHDIYLNHRPSLKKQGIPISKTKITNTVLMHLQQRNIHGKIFGGFLMREMLDFGWVAAKNFLKTQNFSIQDLTNVYFKQAVQVGSGLKIASQITYVQKNIVVVTVEASTINFQDQIEKISCHLHLILRSNKQHTYVYPQSYQESLQHLSSIKAYKQLFVH